MKYFHYIKLRILLKEDENKNEYFESLEKFLDINLTKEKINIEENIAGGQVGTPLNVIEIFLKKIRHTNSFFNKIKSSLSINEIKTLIDEIDLRCDENCDFYMRINKDEFIKNNNIKLINGGDCIHMKFSIASYPKNTAKAKNIIKDLLTKSNA